jgi:hypothetical protein
MVSHHLYNNWLQCLIACWYPQIIIKLLVTAESAVLLGQYQVDSQEFYRVMAADNPLAKLQSKILRTLTMKGPMSRRKLQQCTHAHRSGTPQWNAALKGLIEDLKVGKRDDAYFLIDVAV